MRRPQGRPAQRIRVSIQGGKFTCEDSDSVDAEIAARSEFISNPSIDSDLYEHFKGRRNLIETVESIERTWEITSSGKSIPAWN